jgi:hypothetical protein
VNNGADWTPAVQSLLRDLSEGKAAVSGLHHKKQHEERRPNYARALKASGLEDSQRSFARAHDGLLAGLPGLGETWNLKQVAGQVADGSQFRFWLMEGAYDMADAFNDSATEAVEGQKRLLAALRDFRGSIQNDLKSITAAGERVRDETRKIAAGLDAAIKQLSSPEMQIALSNAERLVAALQAIQDLKSTRLAFAVMGEAPPHLASKE